MTLTDPTFEELRDGMRSLANGEVIDLHALHEGEVYSLSFKFLDPITDSAIESTWQSMQKAKAKLNKKEP